MQKKAHKKTWIFYSAIANPKKKSPCKRHHPIKSAGKPQFEIELFYRGRVEGQDQAANDNIYFSRDAAAATTSDSVFLAKLGSSLGRNGSTRAIGP